MSKKIIVPPRKIFVERTSEFVTTNGGVLVIEHSLLSMSKWESKWRKPFLGKTEKTREETIDYIRCMTLNQNVDPDLYKCLTKSNLEEITEYIQTDMTATKVYDIRKELPQKGQHNAGQKQGQTVTTELVYSWMVDLDIPFSCEKWHFSRLMALIKVLNAQHDTSKMSGKELAQYNQKLNAQRKAAKKARK